MDQPAPRQTPSRFKSAVAGDLFAAADVVDFSAALNAAEQMRPELEGLADLAKRSDFGTNDLARVLADAPKAYDVICLLLSISTDIQFEDGRILPAPSNTTRATWNILEVASLLIELGLPRLLVPQMDRLFLITQISDDAAKRRVRVEARVKRRVKELVDQAVTEANASNSFRFEAISTASLPLQVRRIAEHVISVDGKPKIVIASTFQTYSGGRQNREFLTVFPSVQSTLSTSGMSLALIADGQGMRQIPDKILEEVFRTVPHVYTLSQCKAGALSDALMNIANAPEPTIDTAGLRQLIASTLRSRSRVESKELPVNEDTARLALANYASANKQLALELAAGGVSLSWTRSAAVSAFRTLRAFFDPPACVKAWTDLLSAELESDLSINDQFASRLISLPNVTILASSFLIGSTRQPLSTASVRAYSKLALQAAPQSKVAVLLTSHAAPEQLMGEIRRIQPSLPVTVVVLNAETGAAYSEQSESIQDRLATVVLAQTDLTKLSPFVVRSVTPRRIFFGREEEEATLLSTLMTNSAAILGGRRIGKTSLMQHSFESLRNAGLNPLFLDCQPVRTWADFGEAAGKAWGITPPSNFRPQHLADLVATVRAKDDSPLVILLDEIDQLLDWDTKHSEDEVPEAFFRTCRAVSQENRAQFVFSGERTIAKKIWDPSSPHWNFCRPMMIRQLSKKAGQALIAEPLEAMGIRIEGRSAFVDAAWTCTDGHPELLQLLGDGLVDKLNGRDRIDIHVTPEDVAAFSQRFEFAQQYLTTYWGQATSLEKYVSVLISQKDRELDEIAQILEQESISISQSELISSLSMLELYGIVDATAPGYALRSQWFGTAIGFYGGAERAAVRFLEEIR